MTKPQKVLWLALAGLAIFIIWQLLPERQQQITLQGNTMGTYYMVKLVAPSDKLVEPKALQASIDALLVQVNKTMSTYEYTRTPAP